MLMITSRSIIHQPLLRSIILTVIVLFFMPFAGHAAEINHAELNIVDSGLWNEYASTVLWHEGKNLMWTGGWHTQADEGSDIIYYREQSSGGSWSLNRNYDFAYPGFHVNDPTVIKHPVHDWLFMYFTALSDNYAALGQLNKNWIGFAYSLNDGQTWTPTIVIADDNGYQGNSGTRFSGGWAPSALVEDTNGDGQADEIWVYYHTNNAFHVLRTRFALDGINRLGTDLVHVWDMEGTICTSQPHICQLCELSGDPSLCMYESIEQQSFNHVNVDISKIGNEYVLLTNDANLNHIKRFVSDDGLNFRQAEEDDDFVIIDGNGNWVVTPHAETVSGNVYNVYFGFGGVSNPCTEDWAQRGTDIQCSDSIHQWEIVNQ